MVTKNERVEQLDKLVEQYQLTNDQEIATEIYNKVKWYFVKYGWEDEKISDANFQLARAIKTWNPQSNVFFITWFEKLWMQQRNEARKYHLRGDRDKYEHISIDFEIEHQNKITKLESMIEDVKESENSKAKINAYILEEFLKRDDINDREKLIIRNIYYEWNKYQTDIAKEMGITQAMVHKTIKAIHKRPYANDLKNLLIELMSND